MQDCVAYLQNNPSPARDAFSCGAAPGAAPVSSVVVVPLMGADGVAVGALYFTQSAPCDFGNIQDVLLVRGTGLRRQRCAAMHAVYACAARRHAARAAERFVCSAAAALPLRVACAPIPLPRATRCHPHQNQPPSAHTQGFVHCVTLSLHQRLVGQTEALKAMALQVGGCMPVAARFPPQATFQPWRTWKQQHMNTY